MKYYLLIVSSFLLYSCGIAQIPEMDNLFSITPKWSYLSVDSNHTFLSEFNPHHNSLWGRSFGKALVRNGNIYLLEYGSGQVGLPSFEGYLLHNIDLSTGDSKWIHQENYFSGNKFQITSYGGDMVFRDDDKLEIICFQGRDTLDPIENQNNLILSTFVDPSRHVIDRASGETIEKLVGFDQLENVQSVHPGILLTKGNNAHYFNSVINNTVDGGVLKNILEINALDETLGYSWNEPYVFENNTGIVNGLPQFSYQNNFSFLNPNTGVGLFGRTDPNNYFAPDKVELMYFDTEDENNIHITKVIDVLEILPPNQSVYTNHVSAIIKDDNVLLILKAVIGDSTNIDERFVWMAWFNSEGELLNTIDRLTWDGIDYDFILDYKFLDDELFIISQIDNYTENNNDLYHFYKIAPYNAPQLLGTFTGPDPILRYTIGFDGMEILDNNDVLVYNTIRYPFNEEFRTNVNYLSRFDGADFGLLSSTIEPETVGSNFMIYPNPTVDRIYIKGLKKSNVQVKIVSVNGIEIRGFETLEIGKGIDVEKLVSGVYYLQIIYADRIEVLSFIKY